MGVAGCGKSAVATRAAAALGLPLIEGDDFHSPASVAKMSAGQPLTDADRAGWLARLAAELAARPAGAVLACSALKRSYRDGLRAAAPGLRFAFLQLDRDAALARVQRRAAHFFPAVLIDNQFATLELPLGEPGVLALDATRPLADIGTALQAWCQA
ncbi:gluconokinase [Pelomonas sp. HMWF004]|nr:gluconokinase [Pelomonas sp. HMWF004]